jgi:hypothetical protein
MIPPQYDIDFYQGDRTKDTCPFQGGLTLYIYTEVRRLIPITPCPLTDLAVEVGSTHYYILYTVIIVP